MRPARGRPGSSWAASGAATSRASAGTAIHCTLIVSPRDSESHVAGTGQVHVHQGVEQTHPLPPQLEHPLLLRCFRLLRLAQLGFLQLLIESGNTILQL